MRLPSLNQNPELKDGPKPGDGSVARALVAPASALLLLLSPALGQLAQKQVLRGHVPPVLASLQPLDRLPGDTNLYLVIGLPLRNTNALATLLQQLYDPASTNFHQYLTSEQFAERFGPTEEDYQKVVAYAAAHNLKVTATLPNRMLVDVRASAADVERTFGVTLLTYRHPTESRDFFAALKAKGKPAELIVGEGYNHFELFETMANPYGLAGRARLRQMGLALLP